MCYVEKKVIVIVGLLAVLVIVVIVGFWARTSWENRSAVSVGNFVIKADKVALISDVPGVTISWKNKDGLDGYLESLNFFGKSVVSDMSNPIYNKNNATKMVIALVKDVKEPFYVVRDKDGNIWDAIGESIGADGTVKIDIYRRDWDEKKVNLRLSQTVFMISQGGVTVRGKDLFNDYMPDPKNLNGYIRVNER